MLFTPTYVEKKNGLTDGVGIDDMLTASVVNRYVNMEYNHEHNNLQSNCKINTPNSSSVSTLISPSLFVDTTEGEINVETDELFGVLILQLL